MNLRFLIPVIFLMGMRSCLNIEQDPILLITPTATISAHVKHQRIFATALINVNAQVLSVGNIPTNYSFSGNLSIYDTDTGNPIDVTSFSGGGLSQAYTVTADTTNRKRFVVIASGTINAYADIGNDGDPSNDKLISTGDFYQEAQFIVSELITQ